MNEDLIRTEILDGLTQVDDTFVIDEIICDYDSSTRKLSVDFKASNESGQSVELNEVWG